MHKAAFTSCIHAEKKRTAGTFPRCVYLFYTKFSGFAGIPHDAQKYGGFVHY